MNIVIDRATAFYETIDRMIAGGSTVMDSIMEYCEINSLEVEAIVPLIMENSKLLSIFREESEENNLIQRVSRLPI
jgi:hypothetical protein